MGPHIFSTLFRESVLSLFNPCQLWQRLLSSQQLHSGLGPNLFSTAPRLYHFFSPQLISFCFFPALISYSQQLSPLSISSQLFFPTLLNFSHPFSTLPTSFHRDALCREAFTPRSFYTQKLLHREAEASAQRSFYTEHAVTKRRFFTEQASPQI